MALLGLIALAQIWFIPGYLLLYRTRDIQPLDKLLLAVPLSAFLNFFLVYALVLLHAYTQPSVIVIFVLEITALSLLAWKKSKQTDPSVRIPQAAINFNIDFTSSMFMLFVLLYSCQFINQIGTVFTQSDVVVNWNPWAVSWFNGNVPHGIAWYPQLLPALYSLTYQFISNTRIELFAKLAVSVYPLVALAIFARMSSLLPTERKKILWAAIICLLLVRRLWGGESTVNGYADFPLAFFSLATLYVFVLKATAPRTIYSAQSVTLAVILVCIAIGASLVKQSGVYLGMLVPFFWLIFFRNGQDSRTHLRQSFVIGLAIACGAATWYLYQLWRISTGQEISNLGLLSNLLQLTWYESIVFGFSILTQKLSWLWVILFLASLMHRQVRYVSLVVVLPFILLWAAFVPYDFRNLAAVFPMFAISLAYGWTELVRMVEHKLPARINRQLFQKFVTLIILIVLATALSNAKYDNELLKLSEAGKSQIGDPEINSRLSAYFEFHPEPSLVATPYHEISKIPNLSQRFAPLSCSMYGDNKEATKLETISRELGDPAIHYLLLLPWCDTNILQYFADRPAEYQPVFKASDAIFYKITARQQ